VRLLSLGELLAPFAQVCPNEDGALVAADGTAYPPFIILERGESLDEWQYRQSALTEGGAGADIATAVQTMTHTAQRVEKLHALGWAHRDLKPSNVLRVPRLHTWTLIDFGSAARIGAVLFQGFYCCMFSADWHASVGELAQREP
jgi:serine/threonine protein kinase